jgi:hypothetical protein
MAHVISGTRPRARPATSTPALLACLAGTLLGSFGAPAHAGRGLPQSITFDGHCDGITNIRFQRGHTGSGTAVMTGTWDRSACGLSNVAAGGVTGTDLRSAVTGTYDTQAAGVGTIVLRIFNDFDREWFSIDSRGRVIDSGTWSAGAPAAKASGLPPSNVVASRAPADPQPDAGPAQLPPDIHFDGYCDGITGIANRRLHLQTIVTGTWNLDKCEGTSVPFTSMGNGDHVGGRDTVGTYDVENGAYPVWTVEIFRNGTWIYRSLDGTVFNQGTWSVGPPLAGGRPSSEP